MITDQKQTGVPNAQGVRQRTQLVQPHNQKSLKPISSNVQTINKTADNAPSADYQKEQLARQILAGITSNANAKTTGEMGNTPSVETQQVGSGSQPVATQSVTDYNQDARVAISKMNESELNSLLTDISNGTIKAVTGGVNDVFIPNK